MTVLKVIFWICAFIVFYTFFGYGILVWLLVKVKEKFFKKAEIPVLEEVPEVTLLIAAYNEEGCIAEKMANCLALDYPKEKLKITWVTDGSTDKTPELLRTYPENTVLHEAARCGKTAAINRAMRTVTSPIVVMTDANTMLNADSIKLMVERFADPKVGCVSGEKRVLEEGESAAATEGLYWKYESFLKEMDDRLYSTMGAAGELIGIRRELWKELPSDTLLDDMIISMDTLRHGYKIAYCKDAYALERPSANIEEERKRKVRIQAGGFQSVKRLKDLLNPFRYPVVAFQFFSHRVLRWMVTPSAMVLLLLANVALVALSAPLFYTVCLILQLAFYLCSLIGWLEDKRGKSSIFHVPYYFLFANLSTFVGFNYYRHFNGNAAWEKAARK